MLVCSSRCGGDGVCAVVVVVVMVSVCYSRGGGDGVCAVVVVVAVVSVQ